jgi:LPXTG-motif cell wall-anchored protein
MKTTRFCIYSILLGIGSALIGLVIGFLIKTPSSAITAILIVIGLLFVAGAVFLARRNRKHSVDK